MICPFCFWENLSYRREFQACFVFVTTKESCMTNAVSSPVFPVSSVQHDQVSWPVHGPSGGAETGMHGFTCLRRQDTPLLFHKLWNCFHSWARQLSHRPAGHSGERRGQKGKIQMSRKASNFSQAFFNIELANWRNGKFWRWQFSYHLKTASEMASVVHLNATVPERAGKMLLNNWTIS